MEELNLDFSLDELEIIKKANSIFDYPVAYLSKNRECICFNSASESFIPRYIKWLCNSEWIIAVPASASDRNAFKTRTASRSDSSTRATVFPVIMSREKKVKPGYAKLYKFKDGFAFKRYERLEVPQE